MPRTARSIACVTDIRDKNEIGAIGCMLFSVLSGYKMISVKGAVKKSEEVEKN